MNHFQKYESYYKKDGRQVVLSKDEMIPILSYIMIKSRIPDLVSQMELITAFTSEYMQESSDGCLMSKTYLQLLSTLTYLIEMDHGLIIKKERSTSKANYVINEKISLKGNRDYESSPQ